MDIQAKVVDTKAQNPMRFIQVYTEEDKTKLIALGYEFICDIKQSENLTIHQFRDNDSNINFSEIDVICHKSNFMLF